MTSSRRVQAVDGAGRVDWGELSRDAATILALSYLVLMGGTLNGLVAFRLHVASHVLMGGVLLAWLGARLWQRCVLHSPGLEVLILTVFAGLALTTALSTDPRRSLDWVGLMLVYVLWFYLIFDLVRSGWPAPQMVKGLLVVGGIVIAWGVVDVVSWYADWLRQSGGQPLVPLNLLRLYTLLGDANMLSGFLNLLLPLAVIHLFVVRAWPLRVLVMCWVAGNLFVQFFTSSRGGWLGTFAVLGTLGVLLTASRIWNRRERLRVWWRWFGERRWLLAAVALLGVVLLLGVGAMAWRQMQHPSHGGIWMARRDFWRSAWLAFASSPLYGTGPFTYGTQFMKYVSVPPWRPFPHAHSLPLTVLSEGGVLGLLILIGLGVGLVRALRRAWSLADEQGRLLVSGGIASLTGFAVHSLLDNHIEVPAVGMVAVGVAAWTLALAPAGAPRPVSDGRRLHPLWMVIPAVLLLAGGARSDWCYRPFAHGVELSHVGRWAEAARLMDLAARCDGHFAFYHLQAGYAWGVLAGDAGPLSAKGRDQALDSAIQAYERGIALEPLYAANHANLAVLYRQQGDRTRAMQEMRRAVESAPDGALFHLNLAEYAEESGQRRAALEHYGRVLALRPSLAQAGHYWGLSAVRREALAVWESENAPAPLPVTPTTFEEHIRWGWRHHEEGAGRLAEEDFMRALYMSPSEFAPYLGLGRVYMDRGDYGQAEFYLRQGLELFTLAEGRKVDLLLAYAELAYRQGQLEQAIQRCEVALSMVETPTVYGRGTSGWSPYGWFLFQRESIRPDLLPQLTRLEMTDPLAQRFLELAQWYRQAGEEGKAVATYERILALAPGFEAALRGLEELEREKSG